MAGYNYNLPDTSTRQKLMGISQSFAPDINPYYQMLQREGQNALRQSFGAAQQDIGMQFTPLMRQAQSRLGGSPLLADSGYSNRLNRQLQQGAFGELSNRYGQAAANQSQNQLQALERLIQMRLGSQSDILSSLLGTAQKKRGPWGAIGAGIGAIGGTLLAPGPGTVAGAKAGGAMGGYGY